MSILKLKPCGKDYLWGGRRLVEEYGPYSFTVTDDGRLYCKLGFRSEESALRWFLSFGSKAEILSPEPFRQAFNNELRRTLKIYENT